MSKFKEVIKVIKNSNNLIAFTGAGISVESGIPPFRGENGIWNKYDTKIFDIDYYLSNPRAALQLRDVFYEVIKKAKPNDAHLALARLEKLGLLKAIITQNIDNLHYLAGSRNVIEFHGNTRYFVCMNCGRKYLAEKFEITEQSPKCSHCGGLLKPDFVFFGEPIPTEVYTKAFQYANMADVMLVIGTTGIVYPAAMIPIQAKKNGAKIIEINIEPSEYTTQGLTDFFLQGKATEVMSKIVREITKKI